MAGKPAKSDKEKPQIERFKEKAKELGAGDDVGAFDLALEKVIAAKGTDLKSKRNQ